ncbi:hypothetical protein D3C71_1900050 [compost metagenome]
MPPATGAASPPVAEAAMAASSSRSTSLSMCSRAAPVEIIKSSTRQHERRSASPMGTRGDGNLKLRSFARPSSSSQSFLIMKTMNRLDPLSSRRTMSCASKAFTPSATLSL